MVFAGRRLAHRCACALEDAGFCVKEAWPGYGIMRPIEPSASA